MQGKRLLAGVSFLFVSERGPLIGKRQSAGVLSLFDAKKRRKKRHRSDAVDAGWGCGPRPQDAATLRRPSQALGGLSKEWNLMA